KLRTWRRDTINMRKDGSAFPVQLISEVISNGSGHPIGVVTTCEDITERKRAEEALRQSEERYAAAGEGANDGLWDWDLDSDEFYFSARWKAMLGWKENEVGNDPQEWFGKVHSEDLSGLKAAIDSHVKGETPHFESEYRIQHRDGNYLW